MKRKRKSRAPGKNNSAVEPTCLKSGLKPTCLLLEAWTSLPKALCFLVSSYNEFAIGTTLVDNRKTMVAIVQATGHSSLGLRYRMLTVTARPILFWIQRSLDRLPSKMNWMKSIRERHDPNVFDGCGYLFMLKEPYPSKGTDDTSESGV